MAACYQVEIVQAMLLKGANIALLDGHGRSPSYWLARCGFDLGAALPTAHLAKELDKEQQRLWFEGRLHDLKQKIISKDLKDVNAHFSGLCRILASLDMAEDAVIAAEFNLKAEDDVHQHAPKMCPL
jgi:hypothetical protein